MSATSVGQEQLLYLASEQYLCIIGPSKGSAILRDSPLFVPTNEKLSGKQSNFTPSNAASYKLKLDISELALHEATDSKISYSKSENQLKHLI